MANRVATPERTRGARRSQTPPETCDKVILRSLPKVVFFYPTMIAALIAGGVVNQRPAWAETVGIVFLLLLVGNLMVISFDFPRTASLSLLFFAIALAVGFAWVNATFIDLVPPLRRLTRDFSPAANDQFYWSIGGTLLLMCLVVILIDRHFDYWEVNPMQIIHHRGLLDTVERYPAPGLEMQKDITDVFEFILLRSGRLVIQPSHGRPIVLENVVGINQKERDIQTLLEVLKVEEVGPNDHRHIHGDYA